MVLVIGMLDRAHGPARIEHTAVGMVGFPEGVIAFIEGGGRRKYFAFELELQGTDGVIGVGNSPPGLWLAESSQRFTGFNELSKVKFPEYTPNNGFVAAFEALIEQLETGRDGREALKIILGLYDSAAKSSRKVRLH